MPYIGHFLGAMSFVALFSGVALSSGSVAAQEFGAPPANLIVPKHLVAHRAKVAWIIHRNVVPAASRIAATPLQAEEPESASITKISAEGEPTVATRP